MAVVLVTGGNRGIGAACVRWFLANGDQVATTYRSEDEPPPPEGATADRYLGDLLNAAKDADVVLGSRYVDGGGVHGCAAHGGGRSRPGGQ